MNVYKTERIMNMESGSPDFAQLQKFDKARRQPLREVIVAVAAGL